MSDDPTPELRALAAQLFRAGRSERPAPALGRRLLLIEAPSQAAMPEPRIAFTDREAMDRHGVDRHGFDRHGFDRHGFDRQSMDRRAIATSARPRRASGRIALWIAAAALVGGGIGGWFALAPELSTVPISAEQGPSRARSEARGSARTAVDAASTKRSGAAAAPLASAPLAPAPLSVETDRQPEAAHSPALPEPAPRAAEKSARDARQRRVKSPASSAPASRAVTHPPDAAPATVLRAPASVQSAPAPAASASASASPESRPLTLLEELDLLKRARGALRSGNAPSALELLDRHGRERRSLGLDAEATLLRIETYAALGRRGEASELAARFVRDNPNSALGDRAKTFIQPGPAQTSAP